MPTHDTCVSLAPRSRCRDRYRRNVQVCRCTRRLAVLHPSHTSISHSNPCVFNTSLIMYSSSPYLLLGVDAIFSSHFTPSPCASIDCLNTIVHRQTLPCRGPINRPLHQLCHDRNDIINGSDQLFSRITFPIEKCLSSRHDTVRDTYRSVIVLF